MGGQSGKKRKLVEETETSLEKSEGKRKNKKKKKKGEKVEVQEDSPVGEVDPVDTGSDSMVENIQENDTTPTSEMSKSLLSNKVGEMFQESSKTETSLEKS